MRKLSGRTALRAIAATTAVAGFAADRNRTHLSTTR
jgi:hypothetical protein